MEADLATAARSCLTCHQPIGVATFDGPVTVPGLEGPLTGEVTVTAGFVTTAVGRKPVLRFQFTGPGPDGEARALPPINLLMDADAMKSLRPMIAGAIDQAIIGARRGH